MWYRSQTRFRSGVAVAVAQDGSYSSDSTPSLGTPYDVGAALKKKKKKRKNERKEGKKEKKEKEICRVFGEASLT